MIGRLRDEVISNNPRMFEPPGSPEEEKPSEFGSFLAGEIERRIRLVFGEAPHVTLCREQDDSNDEEILAGISERKKIENTAGFWDLCWADMQINLAEREQFTPPSRDLVSLQGFRGDRLVREVNLKRRILFHLFLFIHFFNRLLARYVYPSG